MRVLQLIDSLRSGGAEKMSVSYANALAKRIDGSFLCCTRMEGLLKNQLSPDVGYLFLNKKKTLDLKAVLKLRKFTKENKIEIIQAHSSSWFLALLVKMSLPKLKLVWHDHYGRELKQRKPGLLKPASKYFDGIIAVNKDLETWSRKNLYCKEIRYIKNFLPKRSASGDKVVLKGGDSFKIICVANFRPQKDHMNLLKAFELLLQQNFLVNLHLVGKDNYDFYSNELKAWIKDKELQGQIHMYGEQDHIGSLIAQADLGVLSSKSEGLPIVLLEYGQFSLPVVCTNVGECQEVLGKHGKLVPPGDHIKLAEKIAFYIQHEEKRKKDAKAFQKIILNSYSEDIVLPELLHFLKRM